MTRSEADVGPLGGLLAEAASGHLEAVKDLLHRPTAWRSFVAGAGFVRTYRGQAASFVTALALGSVVAGVFAGLKQIEE